MSVFLNVNPEFIANKIKSASKNIIYVSAGLDEVVANALIKVSDIIGKKNIKVLLDVSENVLRYGYGTIEGITKLNENGISINEATGIRIGALIYDNEGLIFSPTPLLIEAGNKELSQPNAITATCEQVQNIVNAIIGVNEEGIKSGKCVQDINVEPVLEHLKNEGIVNVMDVKRNPEIGQNIVSSERITNVHQTIKENPPQKFDIARKVQVFSTEIEFVEIKLKGCEIQRHTISIPSGLLVGNVDVATKRQLKAGFNIIENNSLLSGNSIRDEINNIKKSFTKVIPNYGRVILKSKKKRLEEALDILKGNIKLFQETVVTNLENEIKKTQDRLLKVLSPAVTENPPDDLMSGIQGDKPTKEQVEKYLSMSLDTIFPSASNLTSAMSLECIIKAVTYETISSEEFQSNIRTAYPLIDWDKMFVEYDAVRETEVTS